MFKLTGHKIFAGLCVLLIFVSLIAIAPTITIKKERGIKLPIIIYHNITTNSEQLNDYAITPEQLDNDLKYIKEKGYTTINMTQLINHCLKGDELPKKPVMICFDDGFKSMYTFAYPLLKQYDMCAVVSFVGAYADHSTEMQNNKVEDLYLNWNEIEELSKNKNIEIQNHSYNMHSQTGDRIGTRKKCGESEELYRVAINQDVGKMQELLFEKVGFKPNTFVYPFGYNSKISKKILKEMGFNAAMTCRKRINIINSSTDLMSLGRFNRSNGKSSEQFFENILK